MSALTLLENDKIGFAIDFIDEDYAIKLPDPELPKYPAEFPCVQIDSYQMVAGSGVIRAGNPHQSQRRVFNTMPHTINLSFTMPVSGWNAWFDWMKSNGYRWFDMNLPSLYAGLENARMSVHAIRLVSQMSAENMTDKQIRVSVVAEMSPVMIDKYLEAV